MKKVFCLKLEVLPSTSIKEAVVAARYMAEKLELAYVTFSFNGISISVSSTASIDYILEKYSQLISEGGKHLSIIN